MTRARVEMLLLARTSLFALTTGTRALRASVPRMAVQVPRSNLGSSSESEASYTLDGGYALQPGADSTGGWLAHRSQLDLPGSGPGDDWVRKVFDDPDGDLASAVTFSPGKLTHPPRILLLYGSLRESSFSRRLAHECARILELLGADVRVYDPRGLPVRDPDLESHAKVQELRSLSAWSEAHVWVSPEMHGCLTGAFLGGTSGPQRATTWHLYHMAPLCGEAWRGVASPLGRAAGCAAARGMTVARHRSSCVFV